MLLLMYALPGATQDAQIQTGTRTGVDAVRLALPDFPTNSADARLATLFNQVLWDDLDYTGNIALASKSFYPTGRFANPGDIKTEDWTKPGIDAQFIAFGNATIIGNRISVEGRLWDLKLAQNPQMIGQRYGSDATEEGVRLLAHRFADDILEALGFGKGIARTKIAFVGERSVGVKEIYVMDYDGSNMTPLTSLKSLALTPSWSPDGEKLAYTSYARNVPNIAVISRVDRRAYPFPAQAGTNTTPSWSPDGNRIAFATSKDGNDGPEIYVSGWNGTGMKRITVQKGIDISPVWNPRTGQEIAFVSDRSGTPQIYIMDAEGTNVRRIISEGGSAQNPAWSPDGQTLAFAWQKPRGNFDIYLHDLATGRNIQLTQDAGYNERPTWAPDGKHIAFTSDRTGTSQIYTMLADGTKVRRLTNNGKNEGPAWSGYIQ